MSEMPNTELMNRRIRDAVHAWRWAEIPGLLDQGGDPNLLIENGESLLMQVVSNIDDKGDAFGVLDAIVKKGANINFQTKDKDSPLQQILCRERPDLLEWLLKNGADPNLPGRNNYPPLQTAVEFDMVEEDDFRTRLLLAHGANPDAKMVVAGRPVQSVREYLEEKAGLTEVLSATGVVDMLEFAYAARKLLAVMPKKPEPVDIHRILREKAAGKNLKLKPGKPKGPKQ